MILNVMREGKTINNSMADYEISMSGSVRIIK